LYQTGFEKKYLIALIGNLCIIYDAMHVPTKLSLWIKEFVSTPTFSVVVNGSPAGYFGSNKRRKQGDHL